MLTGNKISTQTGIGTGIAIAGVALYSYIKAKMEEEKRVSSSHLTAHYYTYSNDLASLVKVVTSMSWLKYLICYKMEKNKYKIKEHLLQWYLIQQTDAQ